MVLDLGFVFSIDCAWYFLAIQRIPPWVPGQCCLGDSFAYLAFSGGEEYSKDHYKVRHVSIPQTASKVLSQSQNVLP